MKTAAIITVRATEALGVIFSIPAKTKFRYRSVTGTWTYHPQKGTCGPEGDPDKAPKSYYWPGLPQGALCLWNMQSAKSKAKAYHIDFDSSKGGAKFYKNMSSKKRLFALVCNDHRRGYGDNSGEMEVVFEFRRISKKVQPNRQRTTRGM